MDEDLADKDNGGLGDNLSRGQLSAQAELVVRERNMPEQPENDEYIEPNQASDDEHNFVKPRRGIRRIYMDGKTMTVLRSHRRYFTTTTRAHSFAEFGVHRRQPKNYQLPLACGPVEFGTIQEALLTLVCVPLKSRQEVCTATRRKVTFEPAIILKGHQSCIAGSHPAKGLWGIKHTRKPVDFLVSQAKNLPPGRILPIVNVEVSRSGFSFTELIGNKAQGDTRNFTVEVISYGVQDLVYTRVFSMIIVADETLKSAESFLCHSFVCDSRDQARRITYALAAVFQDYGRKVKEETEKTGKPLKRLAIDLRTPEEQAEDSDGETDA